MNPLQQHPNYLPPSAGLITKFLPSSEFSFKLFAEIQIEKEKNRVLVRELEKQKSKSKELQEGIYSILGKAKSGLINFPDLDMFEKNTVSRKGKVLKKNMMKHKKQRNL